MNYGSLTSPHATVVRFLSKNACFAKRPEPYTHLSMDGHHGGVVHVSTAQEQEMLFHYAQDIDNGARLYLTEARTPYFRFFVDTDFKFIDRKYAISPEGRLAILGIIDRVVRLFYPKDTKPIHFRMIILDTSQADKEEIAASPSTVPPVSIFSDEEEEQEEEEAELADVTPSKKRRLSKTKEAKKKEEKKQKEEKTETEFTPEQVVSRAPNPNYPNNNMHVIFPWLIVNEEQAYAMGKAIACILTTCIGDIGLEKDWFDVVDSSVYLKNGLRMIGSRKCEKCPACKGKRCQDCMQIGKVDRGRAYHACAVYSGTGYDSRRFEKLSVNFAHTVLYCSIRKPGVTSGTPGWKRYTGCPALDPDVHKTVKAKRRAVIKDTDCSAKRRFEKLTESKISTEFAEDKAGQRKQKCLCVDIPESSMIYKAATAEVRRFDPVYKHLLIRSVLTTKKATYFRVCVGGEGSSVCFNLTAKKKEHNNNSVYFIIKPSGVYQRCWCSCDTTKERRNGVCKKFTSRGNEMLGKHQSILFPNFKSPHAPVYDQPLNIGQTDSTAELRVLSCLYMKAFTDTEPQPIKKKKKKRKTFTINK